MTDHTIDALIRAEMEKGAEPIPAAKEPEVKPAPSSTWMDDFSPWLKDSDKSINDREPDEPEWGSRTGNSRARGSVREIIEQMKAAAKGTKKT